MGPIDIEQNGAATSRNAHESRDGKLPQVHYLALLAAVTVALTLWVGGANLDYPWIQGDERIFIANNPDVTGVDRFGVPRGESLVARVLGIFTHRHEDLYQPIPIATYAIEWAFWGDARVTGIRRTDVFIHAANALLAWAAIAVLLRRFGSLSASHAVWLGWSLSVLWAMHPALATAYSADMGRTHLLEAFFALISLLFHVHALRGGRPLAYVAALFALVAAMMCKVIPLWFLVVIALEWIQSGWRGMLRSWYAYASFAVCVLFALLAFETTRASGILEDAQQSIFGDPITRCLVGVYYYAGSLFSPRDLSVWYPPDPRTGWSFAVTWAGLLIAFVSALFVGVAWRLRAALGAISGVWFWATLIPVLGLVGARTAAAQDRYLYLPSVGIALALGGVLHWLTRRGAAQPRDGAIQMRLITIAPALLAILLAQQTRLVVADARDMLRRAARTVERDPLDPRAREYVAMAHGFLRDYPEARPQVSGADAQRAFIEHIRQAAEVAGAAPAAVYFQSERDRAAFHRRLSWKLLENREPQAALEQALVAARHDPNAPMTLLTLARAYQRHADWAKELECFAKMERVMPDDDAFRAVALTEYGDLLLSVFERPELARDKFRQAKATGRSTVVTEVKLARCEVLAGKGEIGFQMALAVLEREPRNTDALEVVALYHARSHHWDEADQAYRVLLTDNPTNYEALRGFHEVSLQRDDMRDAMLAWQDAARLDPQAPGYRSFFVWAAACTAEPGCEQWASELRAKRPNDRFASLALALIELRAGKVEESLQWVEVARGGEPIALANEFARAETAIRLLQTRAAIGPAGDLVRATLMRLLGRESDAVATLQTFQAANPGSDLLEAAERMLAETRATTKP